MWSSIIFIVLVCTMGISATPVTSRSSKVLRYRVPEKSDVLIDSNAIPPEISGYLTNLFSNLTPNKLGIILRSGHWADETPYEFKADPDVGIRTKNYQELYNEFLESRSRRF